MCLEEIEQRQSQKKLQSKLKLVQCGVFKTEYAQGQESKPK